MEQNNMNMKEYGESFEGFIITADNERMIEEVGDVLLLIEMIIVIIITKASMRHLTVADLGKLYNKAISPKASFSNNFFLYIGKLISTSPDIII